MTPDENRDWLSPENEDIPSEPDTSDFPDDEYITESEEIDIPTMSPDSIPIQIDTR